MDVDQNVANSSTKCFWRYNISDGTRFDDSFNVNYNDDATWLITNN